MSVTADHQTGMLKPIAKKYNSFDNSLQYFRYAFQNNIDVIYRYQQNLAKVECSNQHEQGPTFNTGLLF